MKLDNIDELTYWMALAHLPKMSNKIKNDLIVKAFKNGFTITDVFQFDRTALINDYQLRASEVTLLEESKKELANNAFLVENLLNQGYEIIPITSPEYSSILKSNLKRAYSPSVIYIKGSKQILKEKSIAIVGSRHASENALKFTDNVANEASKNFKVVVSGFAKGVDKQALDSAINYYGQSIIVLPQGIMTFDSGFKKYYKEIVNGQVMVLSTFFPKASWNVNFAMARNPIIYGLAEEIFVAESREKGGTWSGVTDGLRKGRKIFVRKPEISENNANNFLIEKGAVPVDMFGKIIESKKYEKDESGYQLSVEQRGESAESRINALLSKGEFTSEEIITALNLDWKTTKLTAFLKSNPLIKIINKKPLKFTSNTNKELSLFLIE